MLPLLLAAAAALPPCRPEQLSLAVDGENGAFDGMSHSGTLLVLRNVGSDPCTVPGLPKLVFRDAGDRVLPITRRVPPGMHPGPVVLPVGVAPGAEVTSALRWVSGPVYDHGRCLAVASVAVTLGAGMARTALRATICGPASGVTVEQPVLRTDSTL